MKSNTMPDVGKLLSSSKASAIRQAAASAARENPQAAIEAIAAEVGETKEVVAEMLRSWSAFAANGEGDRQRLQVLEQMVAGESHRSNGGGVFLGESIGAQAVTMLADDTSFQEEMQASSRGMRGSRFTARAKIEGGLRAAITNVDMGQAGDTSIASVTERRPGVVMPLMPAPRLLEALPHRRVSSNEVEHLRLSATGEAGEQAKEGDLKAEIDANGELVTSHIATVAAHTKASRQILSDQTALQQAIDRVLRYKVLAKLEDLIVNGDGTTSKIDGLLNQSATFIPTIGTTAADIFGEAITRQASAGFSPNLVLMHPLDWFRLQITKQAVETSDYVFGSPTNPVPPSLWNQRIVLTPAMPEDTGMVIDPAFVTVLDRWQASVMVATENQDDFIRNLVTILCEVRAGLEVLDETALLKFDLGYQA